MSLSRKLPSEFWRMGRKKATLREVCKRACIMPRAIIDLPVYGSAAVIYIFFIQPRLTVFIGRSKCYPSFLFNVFMVSWSKAKASSFEMSRVLSSGRKFFSKTNCTASQCPSCARSEARDLFRKDGCRIWELQGRPSCSVPVLQLW